MYIFPSVLSFFHQCLTVFRVLVSTSLGRFIPRYFILCDVIVSGIVFKISPSDLLFLVYGNEMDSLC